MRDERRDATVRVAEALRRLEAEVKGRGQRITRDLIARDVDISRSTVSAWFAGKQLPRPRQLELLATVFSANDDKRRVEMRRELFEAAGVPLDLSSARHPLIRARERTGQIIVRVPRYDDAIDQFFTDVVQAFGDFCGFLTSVERVPFQGLTESIAAGDIDICAGLWETPERLLSLRYVGMPLEMGMNALAFANAKLALPTLNGLYDVDGIAPIMHEGQATYRFAQHVLDIPKHRILSCDYDVEAFSGQLLRSYELWELDRNKPVPVLLSDENMCLKVHNHLLSNMVSSSGNLLRRTGLPLLLMDGNRRSIKAERTLGEAAYGQGGTQWGRNGRLIAAHPRYNISICVKRIEQDDWFSYIEDAWRIFIRGNREFLVSKYLDLCIGLGRHLTEAKEVISRAVEYLEEEEPQTLSSDLGRRWQSVVQDWLFDNELRDFHDELTWENILFLVQNDPALPSELRKVTYARDGTRRSRDYERR